MGGEKNHRYARMLRENPQTANLTLRELLFLTLARSRSSWLQDLGKGDGEFGP